MDWYAHKIYLSFVLELEDLLAVQANILQDTLDFTLGEVGSLASTDKLHHGY